MASFLVGLNLFSGVLNLVFGISVNNPINVILGCTNFTFAFLLAKD